jgi:isopentenyldiphosphate isomerase
MTVSKYPPVVVVDENDNEIGSAMLVEVWKKGLYHRIVSVFVIDDSGHMLLQLRSGHVKMYPNRWDQAAGGHVDDGMSYEQAARGELSEELGINNVSLKTLGTFRSNKTLDDDRIINQFERVYLAQVSHGITLKLDREEVNKTRWFTPTELKEQITKHADNFTPGLLYALREYFPDF